MDFGAVLSYIWRALSTTALQILVVLGPGAVLALAMNYLAGFIERRACMAVGLKVYLGLFGWLGTSVHELGHALFCLLFGHKITEMRLFDPDPETGTLGCVTHSYNPRNVYQVIGNFFIGVGPILLGATLVYLLTRFLVGVDFLNVTGGVKIAAADFGSWSTFLQMVQDVWHSSASLFMTVFSWRGLSAWQTYLFIYLVFAVGSSIRLSLADLKGALSGFAVLIGFWFLFNLATIWAGAFAAGLISAIAGYCGIFYAIMFLALVLTMAVAVLILVPLVFIGRAVRSGRRPRGSG